MHKGRLRDGVRFAGGTLAADDRSPWARGDSHAETEGARGGGGGEWALCRWTGGPGPLSGRGRGTEPHGQAHSVPHPETRPQGGGRCTPRKARGGHSPTHLLHRGTHPNPHTHTHTVRCLGPDTHTRSTRDKQGTGKGGPGVSSGAASTQRHGTGRPSAAQRTGKEVNIVSPTVLGHSLWQRC